MKSTSTEVLADVNIADQTFVVTGGSAGLGLETVRALTAADANVFACVRNVDKMNDKASSVGVNKNRLQIVECDLEDLESVANCGDQIKSSATTIQSIILNAGLMFPVGRQTTKQGFEKHVGVNYLANAYLAGLLTPTLIQSAPARLVFVSAVAMRWGPLNFDDLMSESSYDEFVAYGQSCSARSTFAAAYNKKYSGSGVTAFSLHPGIIATELQRDFTLEASVKLHLKKPDGSPNPALEKISKTVEQGAATQLWAATSPDLDGLGGEFLQDCGVAREWSGKPMDMVGYSDFIFDEGKQNQLMKATQELLGFQFP